MDRRRVNELFQISALTRETALLVRNESAALRADTRDLRRHCSETRGESVAARNAAIATLAAGHLAA